MWFPAAVPVEYVTRIRADVVKALADPTVRQLAKVTEEEMALNKKLTAAIGIVPQ